MFVERLSFLMTTGTVTVSGMGWFYKKSEFPCLLVLLAVGGKIPLYDTEPCHPVARSERSNCLFLPSLAQLGWF